MSSKLFKFGDTKHSKIERKRTAPRPDKRKKLEMSVGAFKELRDIIYKLSGIYYTESKKYLLESRIAKRILQLNLLNYDDYVKLLKSIEGADELNKLFEAITINETYFFRAEQQFEAFENVVVPEIIEKKLRQNPAPTFRIWSAASSTGEEPYTLAIIVNERLKPKYPNVQFQIMGSDISKKALNTAEQGVYKQYAIRNIPDNYMRKYFKKDSTYYILSDNIKRMVKFAYQNLYDSKTMRAMYNCDVIFCANVLIYFDLPSKQKVVSHLYDALNKGGYLFIGYSESLHGVSKAFKLIHLPQAMAYKKE